MQIATDYLLRARSSVTPEGLLQLGKCTSPNARNYGLGAEADVSAS